MNKKITINKPSWWIAACFMLATLLYFIAPSWLKLLSDQATFLTWRREVVMWSGVVALTLMTLCMLIAIRSRWLDKLMGGLDKAYGIHKWTAIAATIMLIVHWLAYKSAPWVASLGLFDIGSRPKGGPGKPWWIILGKNFGEWAFYLLLILVVVALVKRIPYKFFKYSHKLFALVCFASAYHSIVLVSSDWWQSPSAYVIVILSLIGSYAGIQSLFGRIGQARTHSATVSQMKVVPAGVMDITLTLPKGEGMPHQPGQFAFINFGHNEEAHPFTIASPDQDDLRFVIKPLGDFTHRLGNLLKTGQSVTVEGPYGQFNFKSDKPVQIWVAGGIGIAPFMAQIQYLAAHGGAQHPITFWYCTKNSEEGKIPDNLDELCRIARVDLHRLVEENGQQLNVDEVHQTVPDLVNASLWFCGPVVFANCLRNGLVAKGLNKADFHAERFEMR